MPEETRIEKDKGKDKGLDELDVGDFCVVSEFTLK